MFLKERKSGHLLAIANVNDLFNPYKKMLECRGQCGEEEQDAEQYAKDGLLFLSDEELPQCWLDPHYREVPGMNKDISSRADGLQGSQHYSH